MGIRPASREASGHDAMVDSDTGMPAAGRLFYVVGPSGVGKDTLLHWLQEHIAGRTADRIADTAQAIVFARRSITRAQHSSEAHESVEVTEFWERVAAGRYAMHWQANGLCYGIGREINADMAAGRDVIVNGSREHVPQVLQSYPAATIVWLHADAQAISARLASRQRESGDEMAQRVARGGKFAPLPGPRIVCIDNSDSLETAGLQLLALLARAHA